MKTAKNREGDPYQNLVLSIFEQCTADDVIRWRSFSEHGNYAGLYPALPFDLACDVVGAEPDAIMRAVRSRT